jgi:hypothetical protein
MASAAGRAGWLFASLRGYDVSWLPGDAMAGMTLAAIGEFTICRVLTARVGEPNSQSSHVLKNCSRRRQSSVL